jgi:hypothetical protein
VTPFLLGYFLGVASVFVAARMRFFLAQTTARASDESRPRSIREPVCLDSAELALAETRALRRGRP